MVRRFLYYKKRTLSERTHEDYTRGSKYLLEKFGDKDIETFTQKCIHEYIDWRATYYKKKKERPYHVKDEVSNTTLNHEGRLLVCILRYAHNEIGLISTGRLPRYKALREHTRHGEILSKDEYQKLKEYFLKTSPYHWQIISFIQNTGIRYPSELLNLKWKDINLSRNYFIVRNRKRIKGDSIVPLIGTAEKIIRELRARPNISTNQDDYVFVNEKGKKVITIRKAWKTALEKCGIDTSLTLYSLRHQYASRLISTRPDIPLKIVAMSMGHVDTKMLETVYGSVSGEVVVKFFQQSEANREESKMARQEQETEQAIQLVREEKGE